MMSGTKYRNEHKIYQKIFHDLYVIFAMEEQSQIKKCRVWKLFFTIVLLTFFGIWEGIAI